MIYIMITFCDKLDHYFIHFESLEPLLSSSLMECISESSNMSRNQNLSPHQEVHDQTSKEEASRTKSSTNGIRRFLGVRQRPSGRWVAEIKGSSQKLRLWLGTFDTPEEAAMAYDDAARLLRGRNAKTNFPHHQNKSSTHEEKSNSTSIVSKNPRLRHLLRHALMKNHANKLTGGSSKNGCNGKRSIDGLMTSSSLMEISSVVEETIVCSSSNGINDRFHDYQEMIKEGYYHGNNFGCSEVSFGSCKVYSSVHVAPSSSTD